MLVYFCRRGGRYYMMALFRLGGCQFLELSGCHFLGLVSVSFWSLVDGTFGAWMMVSTGVGLTGLSPAICVFFLVKVCCYAV